MIRVRWNVVIRRERTLFTPRYKYDGRRPFKAKDVFVI